MRRRHSLFVCPQLGLGGYDVGNVVLFPGSSLRYGIYTLPFFHGNFIQSNDINATLRFAQALLGRRFKVKRLLDNTGIPKTLFEHEAARDP